MSVWARRSPFVLVPLGLAGALACGSRAPGVFIAPDAMAARGTTDGPGQLPKDSGPSCSFLDPIRTPPPSSSSDASLYYDPNFVPQGTSVKDYVTAQALGGLDLLIGTYLRGEVVVYTGTFAAHDDQSVLGVDCPGDGGLAVACKNQSISSGPAVASLATRQGVSLLTVHSLSEHKYVLFQQGGSDGGFPAGVTSVGLVLPDNNAGGNSGTCTGCAPAFGSVPESIGISNLVSGDEVPKLDASLFDGSVTDANSEALLQTYATASLTRATPCQLTWSDLVELNALSPADAPSLGRFVLQEGERVVLAIGSVYTETDAGEYCSVSYSLELYVNASNLADYGVRDFKTFVPDASDYFYECPQ